jgi:hypothetical protein
MQLGVILILTLFQYKSKIQLSPDLIGDTVNKLNCVHAVLSVRQASRNHDVIRAT